MSLEYRIGDVRDRLAEIPNGSIDLVVTSPPFLALRSYLPADHPDKHREIGSEPTPEAFIDTLLGLTAEFERVLAPHGSICIELGDTYSGSGGAGGDYNTEGLRDGQDKFKGSASRRGEWPLAKSLTGIPTLYTWSLAYGRNLLSGRPSPAGQWRIRNVIVWARPNPPVGALGDKFRPATSYITVACKGPKRYFDLDAVRTPGSPNTHARLAKGADPRPATGKKAEHPDNNFGSMAEVETAGAPPLDWHADEHPEDGDWLWKLSTQPYSGSHYACVDDQTEALTIDGWKPHEDLEDGEMIAAYDQSLGMLRWEPATIHRYPYDGDLVCIDQRETVQRLTPNHRVLMQSRGDVQRTIRADELLPSHRVPLIAPFIDDPTAGPTDAWASLLGWFVTEGHIPPPGAQPRAMIYQSESANPDHVATIRHLLQEVGAQFKESRREREWRGQPSVEIVFTIYGESAARLRTFGKAIPATVLSWGNTPLGLFFDAMIDGDGHRRTSGRAQFICKHLADADMFQAIAARLGKRTTISPRNGGGFSVTVGSRTWVSLRGANGAPQGTTLDHYTGVVWCPSVPSSYWLARRSGRPFITGNTFPMALPKRMIEAMCPQRVCATCGTPSTRIVGEATYVNSRTGKAVTTLHYRSGETIDGHGRSVNSDGQGDRAASRVQPTIGWTDCGHDNYRVGVVLDPFAGSGTTLEAAQAVGRHAIGIDLDERNAHLATERVGMFLDVQGAA